MKIGIEAQRIFRKKKHGMDMVAVELIRNLQEIDHSNEYIVFVQPGEDRSVIRETKNFKIVELKAKSYPVWEQIALPQAALKYGCDMLHCTSNTAPLFCKVPLVITLHDIIYMEKSILSIASGKGTNYQKFGNIYRRLVVPQILKKTKKIITVSEFEKRSIAGFFKLQEDDRLTAIYNGVGIYFTPVTDIAELKYVKDKYRLPDKFFFFLGNTDPKKNTSRTLKAFAEFIRQTNSDVKLVMIDFDRHKLEKILEDNGDTELMEKIVLTGYIQNTDLPAIYSQAILFLYPSLRESFGIPIIEAMACGVPVITSNTSSMPEVAGDAAILIDPLSPSAITDAMKNIYYKYEERNQLTAAGLLQAKKFSWQTMASQVLDIYKEMAGTQQSVNFSYSS